MRQIIHFEVGGTGILVSDKFWKRICVEHRIDPVGNYYGDNDQLLQYIDTYFREDDNSKYVPRAILVAANKSELTEKSRLQFGKLYDRRNSIVGNDNPVNSFPSGFRDEAKLYEDAHECMRREAEYCDNLRGFQVCNSISTGIGGGFGSLLLTKIREEYPKNFLSTFSIFNIQNNPNEHYNALLAVSFLREYADQTFLIDSGATGNVCRKCLEIEKPTREDITQMIAQSLAGVTACLRFPGNYDIDIRETYWMPQPKMHFFIPGLAPISTIKPSKDDLTVAKLAGAIFTNNCWLSRCDENGKFLSLTVIFRGAFSTSDVNDGMLKITERYSKSRFIHWVPTNLKIGICEIPHPEYECSATFIGNSTSMGAVLEKLKNRCSTVDKKAYSEAIPNLDEVVNCVDKLIEQYNEYSSPHYKRSSIWN